MFGSIAVALPRPNARGASRFYDRGASYELSVGLAFIIA